MLYRVYFNILRLVCNAVEKLKNFGIGMSLQPSRRLLTVWRVTCISYLTDSHLFHCKVSHHKHFFQPTFFNNRQAVCLTIYNAAMGIICSGSDALSFQRCSAATKELVGMNEMSNSTTIRADEHSVFLPLRH